MKASEIQLWNSIRMECERGTDEKGERIPPPTFSDTPPQYVEAKEAGSITLTCTAFGNPKPSVSWLREGNLMVTSAKCLMGV
ncbi:hypothetical protein PAMP_007518 [Pampus punctatissimus]